MILIVGHLGNMGRRYQAILNNLGQKWTGWDLAETDRPKITKKMNIDQILIATPTATHLKVLETCSHFDVPILCEKPLVTSRADLDRLIDLKNTSKMDLDMVMQYRELDEPSATGVSSYDYFRHGTDGLAWDCIQIVGLARGAVHLAETSDIWKCQLNGRTLSLGDMDGAYRIFMKRWLRGTRNSFSFLKEAHLKVLDMEGSHRHAIRH